jgi:acyl-CoA thioesterase FadM
MRTSWTTRAPYTAIGLDGHVRIARVAEWFQEAAVHASTAAGYPPSRYDELSASWIVRELEVVIDRPIAYDEAVTIETWVSDLRRFRSHRDYRVLDASGSVVARGRADWLFVEEKKGRVRPKVPDDEMVAAFPPIAEIAVGGEIPLDEPTGEPFVRMKREVRASEIDRHFHVNHTAYVAWLEDVSLPVRVAPPRHVRLLYERDARLGDELEVRLHPTAAGGHGIQVFRNTERILLAVVDPGDRV